MTTPSGIPITGNPGTWAGNGSTNTGTTALPSAGSMFRATGDFGSSLYYANTDGSISTVNLLNNSLFGNQGVIGAGNQASLALSTLKSKYNIDYSSLPTYNLGDLQSAGAKMTGADPATFFGQSSVSMKNGTPTFTPGGVTSAAQTPTTYGVQSGDTLSSIAAQYGTNVQALMAANPSITNPNYITPNQQITIPQQTQIPANPSNPLSAVSSAIYSKVSGVTDQTSAGEVGQAGTTGLAQYQAATAAANPMEQMMAPFAELISPIIQELNSSPALNTSMQEEYNNVSQNTPFGSLPQLQTNMMNMQNVMNGTTDDIRNEVTTANGYATESMIQAMSTTRNNVLLKSYNTLLGQYNAASSWVDQQMTFSEDDRSNSMSMLNTKTGLVEQLGSYMQTAMNNTASNFSSLFSSLTPSGYASVFAGTPQQGLAESLIGLPAGSLSNPDTLNAMQNSAMNKQLLSAAKSYYTNTGTWPAWYNPATMGGTLPVGGDSGTSGDGTTPTSTVVGGIDFGNVQGVGAYATDINSEVTGVSNSYNDITSSYGATPSSDQLQSYISNNVPSSPVTGSMITTAANKYGISPAILAATLNNESSFGTAGAAVKTLNPGNVGNTGTSTKKMSSWAAGVDAAAKQLARRVASSSSSGTGGSSDTSSPPAQFSAMNSSRWSTVLQKIVTQQYGTGNNPVQIYNQSAQPMNRIAQSLQMSLDPSNPNKAASDLDLVDSYVQIARGGQNLTEAQVSTLLGGLGVSAQFDVASQKITGSGILDDGTRQSIADLANNIYKGQYSLAQQAVTQINEQASQEGIPAQFEMRIQDPITFDDTSSAGNAKGKLSNYDFVNQSLSALGVSWSDVESKIPSGQIGVILNSNGKFGVIPKNEYDPSVYTSI